MNSTNVANNQIVIDYLIESIRNGHYQEGSRIPTESNLSDKFGISRSSVREALKILQFMGILTSNQGSGYQISDDLNKAFSITAQLLLKMEHFTYKDISDIREALELKALFLIQHMHVNDATLHFLNQCIDEMQYKEKAIQADIKFHQKIAELSGNSLIISITNALSKVSETYILIPWKDMTTTETNMLIKAHREIIYALQNKTTFISENAISCHYNLADRIINKKEKLFIDASFADYSIKDLLSLGIKPEQISNYLNDLE